MSSSDHVLNDADLVVPIHIAAFPEFFMTQLGPSFLREYYRCVLAYPFGILLTEKKSEKCVGFVAGFIDPPSFYRELRRRRTRLVLAAALQIVRQPARLLTLFGNYRHAGDVAHRGSEGDTAELSSLAVRPDASGQGVGSRLVQRFIVVATRHGARRVVLTTDAMNNNSANRFYQKLGFECVRVIESRRGRKLNEYQFTIARS